MRKLSLQDKDYIRRMAQAGVLTQTELAEKFGVSKAYISMIVKGLR